MGSRGDAPQDNAITESFFSTLECECLAKYCFASHAEARLIFFLYIEGWHTAPRVLRQRAALPIRF